MLSSTMRSTNDVHPRSPSFLTAALMTAATSCTNQIELNAGGRSLEAHNAFFTCIRYAEPCLPAPGLSDAKWRATGYISHCKSEGWRVTLAAPLLAYRACVIAIPLCVDSVC